MASSPSHARSIGHPVLGLDIGGTRIKAALVDPNGTILLDRHARTPSTMDDFLATVGEIIAALCQTVPGVQGVGIGCKGIIDPEDSRIVTLPGTLNYLEGALISDLLAAYLPPNCLICADNDARVALIGELVWGAARGYRNVLMLTLGTGVGGAALVDGKILRGASGVGGHIGHLTVDPDGADCICGNRGCLETVFSAPAIESEAAAALRRGVASQMATLGCETPSCAAVFDCASRGDAVAQHIVDRAVRTLAAAAAGLVHVFDPEVVLIGGQIAAAGDTLLEPLRREVQWRTRLLLRRDVPLIRTALVDPSGALGAAALVLQSWPTGR